MNEYSFDYERWRSRSFLEQMANIAAEVGRTFSAKRRGDEEAMTGALYRGLDLIDATAEILAEQKSPRLRELLRAREITPPPTISRYLRPVFLAQEIKTGKPNMRPTRAQILIVS